MLMSHIVSFPGVDAREGTVVACGLFIKTVYLVGQNSVFIRLINN